MLVSNQRPLPCESEACSFAIVRRYLIPPFLSRLSRHVYRERSSTFAPVVVRLSSERRLPKFDSLLPLYTGVRERRILRASPRGGFPKFACACKPMATIKQRHAIAGMHQPAVAGTMLATGSAIEEDAP